MDTLVLQHSLLVMISLQLF